MNRKSFLKTGFLRLGTALATPSLLIAACSKKDDSTTPANTSCTVSPTETKGPFPIKTPAQLVQSSIISDRTGVALQVVLTIQNKNNSCATLSGVLVDIWHCDKDGNYSEYGGTGMQSTDYTGVHFLRGRQTTDANGQVSFLSIFPGWYSGRAPHIHVEVLSASGSSLLVTQIAFPESTAQTVYASSLYSAHGQADTKNANDNVFSDSLAKELATVTGNTTDGYTLTQTIVVAA